MPRSKKLRLKVWAGWCVMFLVAAAASQAEDKTLLEWRFDAAGDLRGWSIGGLIAEGAVRDGALHGRALGSDPILFSPEFEIAAAPMQFVEICAKGTAPAVAELYWTETLTGQYGGFSSEKHRLFHTQGDGAYHVYRIWPFWQAAQKIIRLRLDPPNAGEFDIQWIRIAERPAAASSPAQAWKGQEIRDQWFAAGDVDGDAQGPILLSPPLAIRAADHPFVCVRLATDQPGSGRLFCVSSSRFGWESIAFPLRPDGKLHSYNLAVNGLAQWQDEIIQLGLQVPTVAGGSTRIESLEVAAEPRGPVELEIAYFGPSEGIQRAGRPAKVSCTLQNLGGQLAENVTATLHVAADVKVVDGAEKKIDQLSLYLPKTIDWQVCSDTLGKIDLTVEVAVAGAETVSARTALDLTKAPDVSKASYVPEPKPVRSKYEIGAYYFPGFATAGQWQPIRGFPNRKPILGWYDESNPECADWQIKWAVEHGINFFLVDWYWCQGNRQLEHWIHNAYGKARYKKYLKWAVMWANHNPPNTHSVEDWRKVTQYWIDNYFNMPEYYRIDNQPAVFIWAPENVRRDVGGNSEATKLYVMSQEMAKAAGYPGIYFAAMSAHDSPERTQELIGEGYQAATTYHSFQLAWQRAQSDRFPYADLLKTCPELWREAEKSAQGLLYLPIVDTGWDSRPWHGDNAMVAAGRTPELLGKLCRLARQYADETRKKIILLGPMNEWGEGSYIEPYAEYGFQDLDQVREAFCEPGDWPPNLIPADVGLGPYDLPAVAAKTAWEFAANGGLEGWMANGEVADLEAKAGQLHGRSTGRDPVLQVPGLQVEASRLQHLSFRMRSDRAQRVQVFWATTLTAMNGDASLGLEVVGDGQFHDYEIDLAQSPQWRGVVNLLRIDPATEPDVEFAIEYVRLH
ncbi:MAG: glycoside hydrolase family 99-like domain-containing protein [Pirellulaceae bacterium]